MSAPITPTDCANVHKWLAEQLLKLDPTDHAEAIATITRMKSHLSAQIYKLSAPAIDDGGPASPCLIPTGGDHCNDEPAPVVRWPGMSLRDHFAGQAMQAFFAGIDNSGGVVPVDDERVAERAYEVADAMLKARAS